MAMVALPITPQPQPTLLEPQQQHQAAPLLHPEAQEDVKQQQEAKKLEPQEWHDQPASLHYSHQEAKQEVMKQQEEEAKQDHQQEPDYQQDEQQEQEKDQQEHEKDYQPENDDQQEQDYQQDQHENEQIKQQQQKETQQDHHHQELIPGLKRSLALLCLALLPREQHRSVLRVSKPWLNAFLSGELYRLRKTLRLAEPWIYLAFCPKRLSNGCTLSTTWLEAYDPRFNVWHNLGPLPWLEDRQILKGFAFVSLQDRLYVIGGMICSKNLHADTGPLVEIGLSKDVFVFNCTTRTWKQCASMSSPRVNFACTVFKGSIYVAGGRSLTGQEKGVSSAEMYNPSKDCWFHLPNMSTGRYQCVGVASEEKIYVIGGFAGPEDSEMIHPFTIDRSCVDVFHPSKAKWKVLKGMWQLDVPPNQIVRVRDRLYSSGDALTAWKGRIEEYDTQLNMWKIVDGSWLPMTHPEECQFSERCYLTMAPIGDRLYFLGGYRLLSEMRHTLHTIYIFDTTAQDAASQWQMVEPVEDVCKELCSHCCIVAV